MTKRISPDINTPYIVVVTILIFGSGLHYGIAGVQHFLQKPAGTNEQFALVPDFFIFLFASVVQMM